VSSGEKPDERMSDAPVKNTETPVTGATECMPCVLRSVARVIVTGETILVGIEPLAELVLALQQKDAFATQKLATITQVPRNRKSGSEHVWSQDEKGALRFKGRLYIPDEQSLRQELMSQNHDSRLSGHFRTARTLELIGRYYYWPDVSSDVSKYMKTYMICQRANAPRHLPYGQLSSLPIPSTVFEELTLDFITGLLTVKRHGYVVDAILVIVDRYSKMALYIAA